MKTFLCLGFIVGGVFLSLDLRGESTLKCEYDEPISRFEGQKQVETTLYRDLKNRDTKKLSENARVQLGNLFGVYENPNNDSVKRKYLNDFPREYGVFSEIFDPPTFGELYDGYPFVRLLGALCDEVPPIGAGILVSLASGADKAGEADAPNYLRMAIGVFGDKHFALFLKEIKGRPENQQRTIAAFMADSEGIGNDPAFKSLLTKLKKNNEPGLFRIFNDAKSRRARVAH